MKGLLLSKISAEIISRIEKLHPASKPAWGRMNVSQMLSHCQVPLQVAVNDRKIKIGLTGRLFGKIIRKIMINEKPFARHLPTDRSFLIPDPMEFKEEKARLISLIQRFSAGGAGGISINPHPIFGKMTPEEWSLLSYKHLDHHLRQFGV